jgi:Zn-dependent peptidase ImmA (M78 family)
MMLRSVDAAPDDRAAAAGRVATIQERVNDLKTRLSIRQDVIVSIVAENALVVSVERLKDREGAFSLSFEEAFLETLNEEELTAVIAHELGHVWIFTHHPFLQNETIANRIYKRLESSESIEKEYDNLWKRVGKKGDMARFLGD